MPNRPGQGRKPKPTAAKIRNGSAATNPGRLNKLEPAALPDEPICPDHLPETAKQEWQRIGGILKGMGLWSHSYVVALEVYCETYSGYRKIVQEVADNGISVVTAKGNEMRSPAATELHTYKAELFRLLSEFGLTPSSKSRVSGDGEKEIDPLTEILRRRESRN